MTDVNRPPHIKPPERDPRPRFKTVTREVLEIRRDKDGDEVRLEMFLECNGAYHRRVIEDVTYDTDGMVMRAQTVQQEGLGPCDGKHF